MGEIFARFDKRHRQTKERKTKIDDECKDVDACDCDFRELFMSSKGELPINFS